MLLIIFLAGFASPPADNKLNLRIDVCLRSVMFIKKTT